MQRAEDFREAQQVRIERRCGILRARGHGAEDSDHDEESGGKLAHWKSGWRGV
jgi:hypothetical protein